MTASDRSQRVWKVFCRKGDGQPDFAEIAHSEGYVALGGNRTGPIQTGDSEGEFVRRYLSNYPDGEVRAKQIWKMHTQVKRGDWVCMPSSVTRQVHVGVIKDDVVYFEADDKTCPFGYRRRVSWVASVPTKELERSLENFDVGRLTLNELKVPWGLLRDVAIASEATAEGEGGNPRLRDDLGRIVDAAFELEFIEGQVTLVLKARGGSLGSRAAVNAEYRTGLELLVGRLGKVRAVLTDAVVETQKTSHLSREARQISLGSFTYPIVLSTLGDPVPLAGALSRGQADIGREEAAKGAGNTTRRIRLYLNLSGEVALSLSGLEVALASPSTKRERDEEPTADEEELDRRVARLRARGRVERPKGREQPKRNEAARSGGFERDPRVKAWVLQEVAGTCELCTQSAPFSKKDGSPYLEVHHPHRLADNGPDTVDNAVGICPTCHRALHHAGDSEDRLNRLYRQVIRLKRPIPRVAGDPDQGRTAHGLL